jgi:hypothetical protein
MIKLWHLFRDIRSIAAHMPVEHQRGKDDTEDKGLITAEASPNDDASSSGMVFIAHEGLGMRC